MATIEDLSPEILLEIFSHYIRSEGQMEFSRNIPFVCRDWNELSSAPSLWRHVRTNNWNYLLHLSRKGLLYHTQVLDIDYDERWQSSWNFPAVLGNIPDLKALVLDGIPVSGEHVTLVTDNCPRLERLHLCIVEPTTSLELDRFLTVCGPTLKDLHLTFLVSVEVRRKLVSGIAARCPLLQKLSLDSVDLPVPIHELQIGCPGLRDLELYKCHLITTTATAARSFCSSSSCGFKELKKFSASYCDFGAADLCALFKDSVGLEHLMLYGNGELVFSDVPRFPSDKLRVLNVMLYDTDENLKSLADAVWKWRRTLLALDIRYWKCDVSCVLERLLDGNPNPQLESLCIEDNMDPNFFKEFVKKCKNLNYLIIDYFECYEGRENIERHFVLSREKKEH